MNELRMAISAGIIRTVTEGAMWDATKEKAKKTGSHLKKNWKAYAAGAGALGIGKIGYDAGHNKGYTKGIAIGIEKGKPIGTNNFINNMNKVKIS